MSFLPNNATVGQRLRAVVTSPNSGVVSVIVLVCIFASIKSSVFISVNNGFNIASQMVFILLLALGMTIVLISGGIDLSVGSVMGLCAGVVAKLMIDGVPMVVAMLLAVAAGAGLGMVNGLIITKLGLPDFVATLAMFGVARGLLYLWTAGTPFLDYMTDTYFIIGGLRRPFGYLTVPIIVALLATLIVAVTLRFTPFGRHLYGVGSNSHGAMLSGVSVPRVRLLAYVCSGLLAGVAGVLLAGQTTAVAPDLGTGYEVYAIAAAIIGGAALSGGRGRAIGAVIGTLTLAVTANAMNIAGVDPTWQQVVTGLILLLSVVLDRASTLLRSRVVQIPIQPVAATTAATAR
jgi:ribose transport system permease protein